MTAKQYAERYDVMANALRDLMGDLGRAEKWLADIKDRVLIDFGMPFLSDVIHKMEHVMPEYVDELGDVVHQYHIVLPYPATPEFDIDLNDDLNRVIETCVALLDDNEQRFKELIDVLPPAGAIQVENIMAKNSENRALLLTIWQMLENAGSRVTLDGEIYRLTCEEKDDD